MKEKALTLLITKAGSEKIASLLAEKKSSSVSVAFGDTYKEFNEAEIKLANERVRTPAKISTGSDTESDNNNTVHIQAYLEDKEVEFEIHEIGLLLNETGTKTSTLIGIYRTEKILAKKSAGVDLLLDISLQLHGFDPKKFMINLSNYQPILAMSPASDEKFGTVRLATEQSIQDEKNEFVLSTKNLATEETLKQRKAGFILTTNHLDRLLTNREAKWSCLIDNQLLHEAKNTLQSSFIGLVYHPYQKVIYSICGLYEERVEKSAILYGKYDEKQNSLEIKNLSHTNIQSLDLRDFSPTFTLDGKNTINFYFLISNESSNKEKGNFYKATFQTDSTNLVLAEPQEMLVGPLFTYGNKIGTIANKKIKFRPSANIATSEDISLSQEPNRPLIHIIQDKIYCLQSSSITIYTLNSNKSSEAFTPMSSINISLDNTQNYASTVLGNYIYIFKPDNYYEETKNSKDFYRYNILDNQWQTFTFPSAQLVKFKPNLGSAITVGNDIYLFIVGNENDNKLKVSILKCTPP